MMDLLSLAGRPYRWHLITALRAGRLVELQLRYREGRDRMRTYAGARGGNVVEFLTFRETAYAVSLEHVQMVFASSWIQKHAPERIYDIGSHRAWVLGLGAHYPVTSLDVREPAIRLDSEAFAVGRAEALPWPDASVEFLTCLHSIEHFGLGAYGDDFDAFGDHKAAKEIVRVIKPGGILVLTTTVTGGPSYTVFDAHRVYGLAELHTMFGEFETLDERLFSKADCKFISADRLTKEMKPYGWDLYLLAARRKG
jgi:SAM-dependent methyltransferase